MIRHLSLGYALISLSQEPHIALPEWDVTLYKVFREGDMQLLISVHAQQVIRGCACAMFRRHIYYYEPPTRLP